MKTAIIISTLLSLALATPVHPRQSNLQPFTGALGGITATPVQNSGDAKRPFLVKGDTFVNIGAALQRSCDQQFNACANAANGGDATLSVSGCSTQKDQCTAADQGVNGSAAAGGAAAGGAATGSAGGSGAAGNAGNATQAGATGASCTKRKARQANKKARLPAQ